MGAPCGSIMLAMAVTVIEVGLIVAIMSSGVGEVETLARDTVFAAVMICANTIVGVSLIDSTVGGSRDGITTFDAECRTELAKLVTLVSLCLVLPSYTESNPRARADHVPAHAREPRIDRLWRLFVATQTIRHRGSLLDVDERSDWDDARVGAHRNIRSGLTRPGKRRACRGACTGDPGRVPDTHRQPIGDRI